MEDLCHRLLVVHIKEESPGQAMAPQVEEKHRTAHHRKDIHQDIVATGKDKNK